MPTNWTARALISSSIAAGAGACQEEAREPPPPSTAYQLVRNLERVTIDVRTKLREIEIEVERLEELRADEETAMMVSSRPEILGELEAQIESTHELLDVEETRRSRRFQRFREDAEEVLTGYERRLAQLRKEKPASAGADAGSSK